MKTMGRRRELLIAAGLLAAAIGLVVAAQQFIRRGNLAGSLAASGLALALIVYLLLKAWLRIPLPGLVYQLTRHGALYLLAVLLVAFAALSSANNLLFLVLAGMLAALLVSGLISRLNLADLELQCLAPEEIFAGQETPVRVLLRNLKSWMPSFSIWLQVNLPRAPAPPDPGPDPWRGPQGEVYFPMIGGGRTSSAVLSLRFPRRGVYQQDVLWLRSGFPFGFLVKRARLRLPREILVYPAVDPSGALQQSLPRLTSQWERRMAGPGQDLYRIRPYQAGDSSRAVHWKASAHTGELKVREFTLEEDRRVEILLDRSIPRGAGWPERFEKAVELCASLAWQLHSLGAALRFRVEPRPPGHPAWLEDVYDVMRCLARVEAVPGGSPARPQPDGWFQVIFTAFGDGPGAVLAEGSYSCVLLQDL